MNRHFPDHRWGTSDTVLAAVIKWLGCTPAGGWLIRRLTSVDRMLLELTAGRRTLLGPIGLPILLLTTTGRRSELPRTHPLLYVHAGPVLYVIGSNLGHRNHPAWTENLEANNAATITLAGQRIHVLATPVTGAHWATVFSRFVDIADAYQTYRERSTRQPRIYALTRR